jgi:hypothetical protein
MQTSEKFHMKNNQIHVTFYSLIFSIIFAA